MEPFRSGGMNNNNNPNTSSSNNNNTNTKSSNNELHHIAPLHNKTPIRVTTSKSLQDIAKNTPILQRILPSQVEIVYHRKSGENELKRSKSRKTSKTGKQRDTIDPTSTLNESLNNQSAQVLDDTSNSPSSFLQPSSSYEQSITITNDYDQPHDDNTDPYLKINNVSVVQNLQTRFDDSSSLLFNTTTTCSSNSINSTSKNDATTPVTTTTTNQLEKEVQVQIEQEKVKEEKPVMKENCVQTEDSSSGCSEGCLEIVTILNESIEDMKLQIFNLNTRVNHLETTMKTEMEDLRQQRQTRLKSAKVIAKDMKKMTDVVNSMEWIELEKNVAKLLDRVKNSPAIVKKCPPSQVKEESKIIHNANHKNLSQQETINNNNINNNNNNNQNALPLPIKS